LNAKTLSDKEVNRQAEIIAALAYSINEMVSQPNAKGRTAYRVGVLNGQADG
jgi:hypothetical protein